MTQKLRLVQTCSACPEQYDVYLGDKEVAYFRLRHGFFRADVPAGGETVYSARTRGEGMFEDDERHAHLQAACRAVLEKLKPPPEEEKLYEVEHPKGDE